MMRKLHLCFPPITVKERHVGCDIPLGWTICRGSWNVTLDEAIAMMNGSISPEISGDEHRTVYRCPKLQNVVCFDGSIEKRRCVICCRRDRIKQHLKCRFECENRFDAMAPQQGNPRPNFTDECVEKCRRALVIGLMRSGVSASKIASKATLDMARHLIQIGIDAQYSVTVRAKLSADDIAWPFSRTTIEKELRDAAASETETLITKYQQIGYVNLKVDAGSVLRAHVTHAVVDNPVSLLVPWVMDVSGNMRWNTHDYETFFLQKIQTIQQRNIVVCSVIHDNLSAQSNAIDNVLRTLDARPKIFDIPCFNHMLNLVLSDSIEQCCELRGAIKRLKKWLKLMKRLKVPIRNIPRTRWVYIVEAIQALSKVPGLDDILAANHRTVYEILNYEAHELPAEFVQLYEVLNPLYILSKELENNRTRLPHVIPLMRRCLSSWETVSRTLENDDCFKVAIDCLVTNLLARVRANAFEEAVTAYVLSIAGKTEVSETLRDDVPVVGWHARSDKLANEEESVLEEEDSDGEAEEHPPIRCAS